MNTRNFQQLLFESNQQFKNLNESQKFSDYKLPKTFNIKNVSLNGNININPKAKHSKLEIGIDLNTPHTYFITLDSGDIYLTIWDHDNDFFMEQLSMLEIKINNYDLGRTDAKFIYDNWDKIKKMASKAFKDTIENTPL